VSTLTRRLPSSPSLSHQAIEAAPRAHTQPTPGPLAPPYSGPSLAWSGVPPPALSGQPTRKDRSWRAGSAQEPGLGSGDPQLGGPRLFFTESLGAHAAGVVVVSSSFRRWSGSSRGSATGFEHGRRVPPTVGTFAADGCTERPRQTPGLNTMSHTTATRISMSRRASQRSRLKRRRTSPSSAPRSSARR
jgi:hypothetical protein